MSVILNSLKLAGFEPTVAVFETGFAETVFETVPADTAFAGVLFRAVAVRRGFRPAFGVFDPALILLSVIRLLSVSARLTAIFMIIARRNNGPAALHNNDSLREYQGHFVQCSKYIYEFYIYHLTTMASAP